MIRFRLVLGHLMPYSFYTYISINRIWFDWVLWHINHSWLFNTKSSLYVDIKIYDLVWFALVWFYGISTIVGYLMPNLLYTSILNIWFALVWLMAYQTVFLIFCQILFTHTHTHTHIYIYIYIYLYIHIYILSGLVGFYGISNIAGY